MVSQAVAARPAAIRSKSATQVKPTIEIKIDRHYTSKVYTSGSTISGHALVYAPRDTPFDDFDIIFMGIAATRLDFVQQYPAHSLRPFMKLRMPLRPSDMPDAKVFRAGQRYSIPFTFVVPHQLTLGACTHNCSSPAVREQHLRLPPTVGFWEADDQAPEMAHIEYSIKARAYRQSTRFLEGYHMVKVLPALPEDAPLDITSRDERYNLSKSKMMRKKLFSVKIGRLTATASQPGAVMLTPDAHQASPSTIRVRFDFAPVSTETAPPKIASVSAKLTSATFFGAAPTDLLPNLGSRSAYTANPSLSYTSSSNLFSMPPVEEIKWKQRNVYGRRDSGYSSLGIDEDASETDSSVGAARSKEANKTKCPIRHVAELKIAFRIPLTNRKLFLPTFHSCLISRTYTLHLNISAGPANTSLSLAVPLQIGVETLHDLPPDAGLPSFESAVAEHEQEDSDALWLSRILDRPSAAATLSDGVLPGYEELMRRRRVTTA
ncbi:hypothetical protein CDD82_6968 [Ophiocordyceps australis]|uniref:Bul1 C-terminal domain-containing protein n=1 Tax=Ophiocordyceps australis TaxID=1399860 RepID=A0A2C5YPK8_9HYPO|nr:hypothetical protein CDD82_6968 [Ophiocordyceps australis]